MKEKYNCEICGVEFISGRKAVKTCSKFCKDKRISKMYGNTTYNEIKISTGTTGAISELYVSCDLLKKGYAVFRALSQSCFCDIIAIRGDKILKIEVRTGYIHPVSQRITFNAEASKDINFFAVYDRNTNQVFYYDERREIKEI